MTYIRKKLANFLRKVADFIEPSQIGKQTSKKDGGGGPGEE